MEINGIGEATVSRLPAIRLEEIREIRKPLVWIADDPTRTRTRHLPNAGQVRYE
jgi:hypothetical protein